MFVAKMREEAAREQSEKWQQAKKFHRKRSHSLQLKQI
jgi:hypothetical protein